MGAYLYAAVPVSYRITLSHRSADAVTNDFSGLVLDKYRRFMEINDSVCEKRETKIGGFERTSFEQIVSYTIKPPFLVDLQRFLPAFWSEFSKTHSGQRNIEWKSLPSFLDDDFTSLDFSPNAFLEMDEPLSRMQCNYFLRLWRGLIKEYAYCGWPCDGMNAGRVSLSVFTIANASDKLGLDQDDESQFRKDIDETVSRLIDKYDVAELVTVMGF